MTARFRRARRRAVWLSSLGLLAVSLLLSALLIEGVLRVVPNKYRDGLTFTQASGATVQYRKLDEGLFTLEPGRDLTYRSPCIQSSGIAINDLGFRGEAWPPPSSKPRIAVLGDSFLEALQVGEATHASAIFSRLLDADVLNAAVSGYSTLTELAAYRRFVRPERPDLVLLFVFLGNDIQGNACRLDGHLVLCGDVNDGQVTIVDREAPMPAVETSPASENGVEEEASYVERDVPTRIRDALRRNVALYHALHDLRLIVTGAVNYVLGRYTDRWNLYVEPAPQAWTDAWRITETAIAMLQRDVAADGARIAVVAIPEHFALSPTGSREIVFGTGSAVPETLDLNRPSRRLGDIATRLGIPFLDLAPPLVAYRDQMKLDYPYFSFVCEGHWNPLTHSLVAHEVAAFVTDRALLPRATVPTATILENRRTAFARHPADILDSDARAAIYGGGLYRSGPTN